MKPEDEDYDEILNSLFERNRELVIELEDMRADLKVLQDENDSLWHMLDEIKKSDIEEHKHLLEDLEMEVKLQSLMYTTKKGIA